MLVLAGVWGCLGPFGWLRRVAVGLGGLSCVCGCVRMHALYGCWRCVGVGESKLLTGVGQEGVGTPCVGTCRRMGLIRTVRPAP